MRYLLLLCLMVSLSGIGGVTAGPAAGPTPRVVFDLTVSTEWQPGASPAAPADPLAAACGDGGDAAFLSDLQNGLRELAAYFYSYTGGQMALGEITIYTNGEQWESADLRFLANSSYRPTAFVGGVVDTPTAYPLTGPPRTLFYPAPVVLGRLWNGDSARCGPWSAPAGWRTLGHELGHHALFLFDEYANQFSDAAQYCGSEAPGFRLLRRAESAPAAIDSRIPSLMAYHYTTDQLSLWPAGSPPPSCDDTAQDLVYGEPAWATLERFYGARGVTAPTELSPGPAFAGSPAADLLNISVAPPAGSLPATTTATVTTRGLPASGSAQAYLIRPDPATGAPQRIIGQGNLPPGSTPQLRFWGVQSAANDRAAIVAQDLAGGARLAYPADYRATLPALRSDSGNELSLAAASWAPNLTITPIVTEQPGGPFSTVSGLQLRLTDCSAKPPTGVEFVYCPAGGDCSAPVTASAASDGSFTHTFFFDAQNEAALHGYIYAREPFRGAETTTWYQIGGGVGPAHGGAHAPAADGLATVDIAQNDPRQFDGDTRVIYSPAQVCATDYSLPAGVLGLIDVPLYIQAVVADPNGGQNWGSGNRPPLRLRLSYDQERLDRLGIDESRLVLLRLNGNGFWERVPAAGQSDALNWIAAEPRTFEPDGAIYAIGYGPVQVSLPLVVR